MSRHRSAPARPRIRVRHGFGDRGDRELHAGTRVHPRHADRARLRRDRALETRHHLRRVRLRAIVVQRDVPDPTARALSGKPDRLVLRVVIVLGRQDLLIGSDPKAVVRHRECLGRVRRQAQLVRRSPDVPRDRALQHGERVAFRVVERGAFDPQRVRVDQLPIALDHLSDRLRLRDEQERREMDEVLRQGEERSHRPPVDVTVRQRDRFRVWRRRVRVAGSGVAATGNAPGGTGHERSDQLSPIERRH